MKLFKNADPGKTVKGLTALAGIFGLAAFVANFFLDDAKHAESIETARETAREEARKILAENNGEA